MIFQLLNNPSRQKLVRIQRIEVHTRNGLTGGIIDAAGIENELGVAVPGYGIL